jgi:hypothetical protein
MTLGDIKSIFAQSQRVTPLITHNSPKGGDNYLNTGGEPCTTIRMSEVRKFYGMDRVYRDIVLLGYR